MPATGNGIAGTLASEAATEMAHLHLSLLGPFQAELDRRPLIDFESNKVRALLVLMAVDAAQPHPRETLAEML